MSNNDDFVMHNLRFPIKTKTSCVYKWSWSTIFLSTATTSSCHRCTHIPLTVENFENFHNLPRKIEDRKAMLNGEWPKESESDQTGCRYCRKIEDAGGFSDRMLQMNQPISPYELQYDPNAVEVTPRLLEIYFSNKCNLSCLYCHPRFSSRWEKENKIFAKDLNENEGRNLKRNGTVWEFDQFQTSFSTVPVYEQMLDRFWNWWKINGKKVGNLQILGGEPFFQSEVDQLIELISQYPNPGLYLTFISNLMVSTDLFKNKIEKLQKLVDDKKIENIRIVGSIDGWGREAEFVRFGLDLKQWQNNFEFMLSKNGIISDINIAINPLTIKTMPDLMRNVGRWNKIKKINVSFMSIVYPEHFNPAIFGKGVFTQDFVETCQLMANEYPTESALVDHLQGICKQIDSSPINYQMLSKLRTFLDEIDYRRNVNWREVFPWLNEIFNNLNRESENSKLDYSAPSK